MMTVQGPRVLDFTDTSRELPVDVVTSPVFELLLSLFVLTGEQAEHDLAENYEHGSTFIEQVEQYASLALKAELREIGACGGLWLSLIGEAEAMAEPRTVDAFTERLRSMDAVELRRLTMRNAGINERHGFAASLIDAAAGGDVSAIDEIFTEDSKGAERLMRIEPERSKERLIETMVRFHDEVFVNLDDTSPILERDAEEKRSLAKTLPPDQVVELATNGVTFQMAPSVSRILLIPSVIIRPWAVISERGTTRIFCYSVADEHLEDDPDAPPQFLVEIYKALADEKRLRLLGALAQGDLDLKTLADRVDLAKSTTHHHLRILRSAGLVRVVVGDDDKKYSLRKEALSEAGPMLERFVVTRSDSD